MVEAAFEAAASAGVNARDFWQMTPYESACVMRGYARSQKLLAWQIEAYSRTGKLPDPAEIMGLKQKGIKAQNGTQIVDIRTLRAMMMARTKFAEEAEYDE